MSRINRQTPSEATGAATGRRRLAPGQREQMILEAAIDFFAEHGFGAHTRLLAERIGVSQALIFRYFGTKEALTERVFQRTFLSRWDPSWESLLKDRSLPLRDRLKAFYRSYLTVVDDRRWIRIAMRSSLENNDLTRRYIQDFVTALLKAIAVELRHASGSPAEDEPTPRETEVVWHLHSTVIYYLIRKHIHQTRVNANVEEIVDAIVDNFLEGSLGPDALAPDRDAGPVGGPDGRRLG